MTSTASAQRPHVVDVYSVDYAFTAPDTIPAGPTTFHLINRGPSGHIIVVFALPAGMSLATFDHLMRTDSIDGSGEDRKGIHQLGGPYLPPSGSSEASATIQLEPGHYVLVCPLPMADGSGTHRMHGMFRELTVVPATGRSAAMPSADLVIHLTDFAFDGPDTLARGHHVIRFENDGRLPHMALVWRLEPGKSSADIVAWGASRQGPPPFSVAGGATDMVPGRAAVVPFDLTPGRYVIVCLANDGTAPKAHWEMGMSREFTVPGGPSVSPSYRRAIPNARPRVRRRD